MNITDKTTFYSLNSLVLWPHTSHTTNNTYHTMSSHITHITGAAHWSVVCHLQHQVPSSRCARQPHHWEKVVADLWGSQGVSDPGVPGVVLMCVQTLPLPSARWDSQCASNDWRHTWEVVRPGGGVHARTKSILPKSLSNYMYNTTTPLWTQPIKLLFTCQHP